MANSFSQMYVQMVFAVKGRDNFMAKSWRTELHKYISGIIKGKGQKPIIVNGVADHIHIFVGLKPAMAASDLVRDIKNNSTNFVNSKGFSGRMFSWQEGAGYFTYGHSQIDEVYKYILQQEEHHKKRTFKEEYLDFLKKFEIPYDERYLFEWYD